MNFPYASDYSELLIKEFYPFLSKRWDDMLEIHYEVKDVARRLKYSKEEFINQGKWKTGCGKEHELITKNQLPKEFLNLHKQKVAQKKLQQNTSKELVLVETK